MFTPVDVAFDFTQDTPHYWDHFWDNNEGLGAGSNDPDANSQMLRTYHQILWSRTLPNGKEMQLTRESPHDYLSWNDLRFGSDSITASFRYKKYRWMLDQVSRTVPDYRLFVEAYLRQTYTIGGSIIFPKRRNSINQARGCNPLIRDRWDLTLECIRRFYQQKDSPLFSVLAADKEFFDLFIDFKGYVDFFFLQDCVASDYQSVNIWLGEANFSNDPLPKSVEEYLIWINAQLDFVQKRNSRINNYINKTSTPG